MDIGTFLLRKQWLKKDEYIQIIWESAKAGEGKTNGEGYLEPAFQDAGEPEDIAKFRPCPFGDVLEHKTHIRTEVLKRSESRDLDELIEKWQQWHVDNMQPISDFRLGPKGQRSFGRRLYEGEFDKRRSAEFVADNIVHNADRVILPEGTSTFWTGVAVLRRWRNLWIITSNGPLVRELHENPKLREHTQAVTVAGGALDLDESLGGSASRGFIGGHATAHFEKCFDDPGATVLVSSVNGILPERGPFAPPCADTKDTRYKLLGLAFKSNIRRVVFICDHTKMRPSRESDYGDPIFSRPNEWHDILREQRPLIALVTVPPPDFFEHEELVRTAISDRPTVGQGYSRALSEYLQTAAEFHRECGSDHRTLGFLEAGVGTATPAPART